MKQTNVHLSLHLVTYLLYLLENSLLISVARQHALAHRAQSFTDFLSVCLSVILWYCI